MKHILREFIAACISEAAVSTDAAAAEGLALFVYSDGSTHIEATLYNPDKILALARVVQPEYAFTKSVVGTITLRKRHEPCNGAWEVVASAAQKGYGPLMYEIGRALVPTHTIMADRNYVSKDANSVWRFYLNRRSDVKKLPLDNIDDPKTPPLEDDCTTYEPEEVHGRDMNPLNYAIAGGVTNVATLKSNHMKAIPEIRKLLGPKKTNMNKFFMIAAARFFDQNFVIPIPDIDD